MTEKDELLLYRHFDGEMTDAETSAFAERLATEPALAEELALLETGKSLLSDHIAFETDAADFDGFFEAVSAKIGNLDVALESAQKTASEPAPTPARPAGARETGFGGRIAAWWKQYWTPVLVSAGAAAAVAFFVTRSSTPATAPDAPTAEAGVAAGSVTVDSVENDGNLTVLINQPMGDDDGETVIWLLEDEEGETDASPDSAEDPI